MKALPECHNTQPVWFASGIQSPPAAVEAGNVDDVSPFSQGGILLRFQPYLLHTCTVRYMPGNDVTLCF